MAFRIRKENEKNPFESDLKKQGPFDGFAISLTLDLPKSDPARENGFVKYAIVKTPYNLSDPKGELPDMQINARVLLPPEGTPNREIGAKIDKLETPRGLGVNDPLASVLEKNPELRIKNANGIEADQDTIVSSAELFADKETNTPRGQYLKRLAKTMNLSNSFNEQNVEGPEME